MPCPLEEIEERADKKWLRSRWAVFRAHRDTQRTHRDTFSRRQSNFHLSQARGSATSERSAGPMHVSLNTAGWFPSSTVRDPRACQPIRVLDKQVHPKRRQESPGQNREGISSPLTSSAADFIEQPGPGVEADRTRALCSRDGRSSKLAPACPGNTPQISATLA